jgi:hypothetical protein
VGEGTDPGRAQELTLPVEAPAGPTYVVTPSPDVVAARAKVLAARGLVDEEIVRLEASARAAVDIPAKVKRNPVKAAGIAAGAGFLLVGGPRKVFRRAKRAVLGPQEPLPPSMLPDEIDASLRKLGGDGERVRGLLEREFAQYLEDTAPRRNKRDLRAAMALMVLPIVRPLSLRLGRQLVEQIFAPGTPGFEEQLAKIRARAGAAANGDGGTDTGTASGTPPAR